MRAAQDQACLLRRVSWAQGGLLRGGLVPTLHRGTEEKQLVS